jgi:hypothetical protein
MSAAADWAEYEASYNEAYRIFRNDLNNVAHMAEKNSGWGDPGVQDAIRACREKFIKAEAKAWDIYFNKRASASLRGGK